MHDRDAPDEDVDFELGPRFNQGTKQLAQRRRCLRREVRAKPDTPVKIPANNQNGSLRLAEGILEMCKIRTAIDQNCRFARLANPPAVPAGLEDMPAREAG